jgi:transcriptional regulator of acetoin/glycerol metabolism
MLARCNAEGRLPTFALTEALLLHPWPLNVRGLLNVIGVAALVSPQGTALDLHAEVVAALEAARTTSPVPRDSPPDGRGEPEETVAPRAAGRRALPADATVERALVESGGSVATAARTLGASRQQIYRWLEQRKLTIERFRAG